jgi:hypothetical protein
MLLLLNRQSGERVVVRGSAIVTSVTVTALNRLFVKLHLMTQFRYNCCEHDKVVEKFEATSIHLSDRGQKALLKVVRISEVAPGDFNVRLRIEVPPGFSIEATEDARLVDAAEN